MRSRSFALLLLVFLTSCGSGDGWYESKDYGQWSSSEKHGGRWYGTGEDEEEDSWWCKYMGNCEEEKEPLCTQYGNCKEDKSPECSLYGNCDDDANGNKNDDAADKNANPSCSFYGNC